MAVPWDCRTSILGNLVTSNILPNCTLSFPCRFSIKGTSFIFMVCSCVCSSCNYFASGFSYCMGHSGFTTDLCRCLVDKAYWIYEVGFNHFLLMANVLFMYHICTIFLPFVHITFGKVTLISVLTQYSFTGSNPQDLQQWSIFWL